MKKYITLLIVVFITVLSLLISKEYGKINQSATSHDKKLARTPESIQKEIIEKKIARRKSGYAKQDKPDKFLEYIHLLKSGFNPEKNYPFNHEIRELKSAMLKASLLKGAKVDLDWKERGPGNVGGRTRGFIVDPADAAGNTWYAGSVGGGIWKTLDAGENWVSITPDWPNLSVGWLYMSKSNHDVIYAGTGEGYGNLDAILGNGIFKTEDRGNTWQLLAATAENDDFKYVNRIIVDPNNENIVVAATNSGVLKSVDGGISWMKKFVVGESGTDPRVQDIRFSPDNFNVQFAAVNKFGIISSVDGGDHWKRIKTISDGRLELCAADNFPDRLYAMSSNSDIYISEDGGDNWEKSTPVSKVDFLGGQGWYNNTMEAHPTDVNKLYVGGIDVHEVTIGNKTGAEGSIVYDIIDGTGSVLSYRDVGGQYLAGGLSIDFTDEGSLRNFEIRMGEGYSQYAYRFTVNGSTTADISDVDYIYRDYVVVPFEIWDTQANVQLMVSFRDQEENGVFDLSENSLEQIIVHRVVYNESVPDIKIADNGGVSYQKLAHIYPVLQKGKTWDPVNMAPVTLLCEKESLKSRAITSQKLTIWSQPQASNYSHADHHNLIVVENGGPAFRLIDCNDGGIAFSDDAGINWESPIRGYVTTQFYGVAKHPTKNIYIGGMQDNGTFLSGENPNELGNWSFMLGGDGFDVAWHSRKPEYLAGSVYNNAIMTSYDSGATWNEVGNKIEDNDGDTAPFVTKIASSPSSPDLLMVGGSSGIWRSEDFGKTWSLTTMPEDTWKYGAINPQIAISPVDPKIVWAGDAATPSIKPLLSSDGGKTFAMVNSPENVWQYISRIIPHPTDANAAYLVFAGYGNPKVYKTSDLGQSWNELSGFGTGSTSSNGFPDVATYTLIAMPYDDNVLWAGTEIGLFETIDSGVSWHFADNGLPAVSIWDMKIVGDQVIVGTHGRGVWTVDMPELNNSLIPPYIESAAKRPKGDFGFRFQFDQVFDKVDVIIDNILVEQLTSVEVGSLEKRYDNEFLENAFPVQLKGYSGDKAVYSNYVWVDNPSYEQPVEKYLNNFEFRKDDFFGNGFKISNEVFADDAIHTDHPYAEGNEFVYQLKYPIIVMEDAEKANMSYRDIAFVEKGDPGTTYGDKEFWDYVIVEGSKDGVNWISLEGGYDFGFHSNWDNGSSTIDRTPSSSQFVDHTINLQEKFAPKDTILVRFRLYSDAYTAGWGWIIDDIRIQEEGTSLNIQERKPEGAIKVSPNPATSYFNLSLENEKRGKVIVNIYNLEGVMVYSNSFIKQGEVLAERIETENLGKGMVLVSVQIEQERYQTRIVVR
ncbi:T9SS C-terminal target domain-containing protein [Marinilabiliaceae bacterium JC017]|nr:T9SS C-terminal target domain-containing protein [Marinilabiliaceae bacterium JC017]